MAYGNGHGTEHLNFGGTVMTLQQKTRLGGKNCGYNFLIDFLVDNEWMYI